MSEGVEECFNEEQRFNDDVKHETKKITEKVKWYREEPLFVRTAYESLVEELIKRQLSTHYDNSKMCELSLKFRNFLRYNHVFPQFMKEFMDELNIDAIQNCDMTSLFVFMVYRVNVKLTDIRSGKEENYKAFVESTNLLICSHCFFENIHQYELKAVTNKMISIKWQNFIPQDDNRFVYCERCEAHCMTNVYSY